MPFGMSGHVQSVLLQGKIYVGGGFTGDYIDNDNDHLIMEYDIATGEWNTLPWYKANNFTMTLINNKMVLVGGLEQGLATNVLGVWEADCKEWTYPFPEMLTARSCCSAVAHNEWLIVVGGWAGWNNLSSVEMLNLELDNKQWHAGPPIPTPWSDMRMTNIGDMWYFMGGYIYGKPTEHVYAVSFHTLVMYAESDISNHTQPWKEIAPLPTMNSAPLSINGFLLAVGGTKKHQAVNTVHLYRPDVGKWVRVGQLPFPRSSCTCTVMSEREIFMAGGEDENDVRQSRMDTITIAIDA